jgi:hypothetical protein
MAHLCWAVDSSALTLGERLSVAQQRRAETGKRGNGLAKNGNGLFIGVLAVICNAIHPHVDWRGRGLTCTRGGCIDTSQPAPSSAITQTRSLFSTSLTSICTHAARRPFFSPAAALSSHFSPRCRCSTIARLPPGRTPFAGRLRSCIAPIGPRRRSRTATLTLDPSPTPPTS